MELGTIVRENPVVDFENTEISFSYLTTKELRTSLLVYKIINIPMLSSFAFIILPWLIARGLPVHAIIAKILFKQFFGGHSLNECTSTIEKLSKAKVRVVLDFAKEGAKNIKESLIVISEIYECLKFCSKLNAPRFIVFKLTGLLSPNILEKLSCKKKLTEQENLWLQRVMSNLKKICQTAKKKEIHILIDAEESWLQPAIDNITLELMQTFNQNTATVYFTLQCYKKDAQEKLQTYIKICKDRDIKLGVKLVRGAYLEKEKKRSDNHPLCDSKEETDNQYDTCLRIIFSEITITSLFLGTHNEKSVLLSLEIMKELGVPFNDERVSFSQLFGMSDPITFNLASIGANVYKYLPYGPSKDAVPYLLRRAKENSSVRWQMNREIHNLEKELQRRKSIL